MSHEINQHDRQEGLTQAWHGLTVIFPVISLLTCWLAKWDVKARDLFRPTEPNGDPDAPAYAPTGWQELVCTDNESIVVSKEPISPESYHVLTNKAFLALVADCMSGIPGAIVASVGSLCNRARIFVTLAVPDVGSFVAAGRVFKPYLSFLSSHDKSAELTVVASTVCTVCNNTFSANLQNTEGDTLRIGIKHRPGMAARIANIPGVVAAYYATVEHFKTVMDKLASMPCNGQEAQAFFAGLLMDGEGRKVSEGLSTVSRNKVDRLVVLFATGKGNHGKDWSDVFQAVTDFYTHESAGPTLPTLPRTARPPNPARSSSQGQPFGVGPFSCPHVLSYLAPIVFDPWGQVCILAGMSSPSSLFAPYPVPVWGQSAGPACMKLAHYRSFLRLSFTPKQAWQMACRVA